MPSSKFLIKKDVLSNKVADYLLHSGLMGSSLRSMAAAAGLSDRMLLHYFKTKQHILEEALNLVAVRFLQLLESSSVSANTRDALIPRLSSWLRGPEFKPYIRIWLELAALGAEADPTQKEIGRRLGEYFHQWLGRMLGASDSEEDRQSIALIFATFEGVILLEALGSSALAGEALLAWSRRDSRFHERLFAGGS